MTENMKKWLELVSQNEDLQKKLVSLQDKTIEQQKAAAIALAKENGITLTDEDLEKSQSEELSDDELDAVAGGGGCGCPFYGYGEGNDNKTNKEYTCDCLVGGSGGVCIGKNQTLYCFCPIIGGGTDTDIK